MPRYLIALFAVLLLAHPGLSQPADTLTLDEALRIALRENLDLQEAEYQTRRRDLAVTDRRMDFLPAVSMSSRGSRRYGLSFDQTAGRLTQTATDYLSGGVSVRLPLFDGFRRVASLREAGARANAAKKSERWSRQTVIYQTISDFMAVLTSREIVAIRRASLEAQKELLAQVGNWVEVGRRPQLELYQQQEITAASQSSLLQAQHDLEIARMKLAQTLGRSMAHDLRVKAPAIDSSAFGLSEQHSDLTQIALRGRADVRNRQAEVEAARYAVDQSQSAFWPSLYVSGSYNTSYSTAVTGLPFDRQLQRNRGGGISLGLSIPLSTLFTGHSAVQRAKLQRRTAQTALQQKEQEVAREVRQAYLTHRYLHEQLEVDRRRLKYAKQALAADEERYRLGRSALADVAQTRARYVEAQSSLAQTRYNIALQTKAVQYRTGQLTLEEGEWD